MNAFRDSAVDKQMEAARRIGIRQALKCQALIVAAGAKAPVFDLLVVRAETDRQNVRSYGQTFLRLAEAGQEVSSPLPATGSTNKRIAKVRVTVLAKELSTGGVKVCKLTLNIPFAAAPAP